MMRIVLLLMLAADGVVAAAIADPARERPPAPAQRSVTASPRVPPPQRREAEREPFFQPGPHDDPRLERGM